MPSGRDSFRRIRVAPIDTSILLLTAKRERVVNSGQLDSGNTSPRSVVTLLTCGWRRLQFLHVKQRLGTVVLLGR